jgi:hypothetical protein
MFDKDGWAVIIYYRGEYTNPPRDMDADDIFQCQVLGTLLAALASLVAWYIVE